MVWHIMAIRAIANATPEHSVTLMTTRRTCADHLLAEDPRIHEFLWLDGEGSYGIGDIVRLGNRLRPYRFRDVWILDKSRSFVLAAAVARIPKILAYGHRWPAQWIITSPGLPRMYKKSHTIVQAEMFLQGHGLYTDLRDYALTANPQAVSLIQRMFAKHPKPWITLGFGSTESFRTWPKENFAALICALSRPGHNTLFLSGAPHETETARWVQHAVRSKGKEVFIATHTTFSETMALLSLSDWFIGNDSGLLNTAPTLGVPSLGLFHFYGVKEYSLPVIIEACRRYDNTWRGQSTRRKTALFPSDAIPIEDVLSAFDHLSLQYGNEEEKDPALRRRREIA